MIPDDPSAAAPAPSRWSFAIDLRDILFVAGGVLVVVAAAAVDWRAAAATIGVGLCLLARRLAR